MPETPSSYLKAIQDFTQARQKAALEELLANLTGRSAELLPYDTIRTSLRGLESAAETLEDIPINAIVGSVGRYSDFTRSFLPRRESDKDRWAHVKLATEELSGVPPISAYRIGQAYFVRDGNHRVSIARQIGASHIQGYVTPVVTRVPLTPQDDPKAILIKSEYASFLEITNLDDLRPNVDLMVSETGQYDQLLEHISVHRYFMGIDQKRPIRYQDAITDWYDHYFLPVVQTIQQRNLLRDFPQRTATDLYLWLCNYRSSLVEELGWEIKPETAASDLAARFSRRPVRFWERIWQKMVDYVTPDELEFGPPAGEWRQERQAASASEHFLFNNILVAVTGDNGGWYVVDYALDIARRENAWLGGLHIAPNNMPIDQNGIEQMQAEFQHRAEHTQVAGKLVVERGNVARIICERSHWMDMVVLRLSYPPPLHLLPRIGSGFRTIIRRCSVPILAVPLDAPPIERVLLAYDGSPKAHEALYIAAYLAGRWNMQLTVVTGMKNNNTLACQCTQEAREYLESQQVEAAYICENMAPADLIQKTTREKPIDLIIMGSYGSGPLREILFGSTVDRVLANARQAVLICK